MHQKVLSSMALHLWGTAGLLNGWSLVQSGYARLPPQSQFKTEWQTCCADVAQLIKGRQDLPGQMGRHGIQGLEGLLTWGVHVLALEQLEDPQLPLPSVLHLLCKSSLCDATVSAE